MPQNTSSNSNPWFAVSMGLVGLIVGYGLATGTQGGLAFPKAPAQVVPSAPNVPAAPEASDPAEVDDDAMLGEDSAPITLIEFTDYQCPFCSRFFTQTYPQIKKNYVETGKVKYVVRDFPLSFHPNAQKAAEATECADEQDQFWAMHDVIFSKQADWSNSSDPTTNFVQYARDLNLDVNDFQECLSSDAMAEEVRKDLADGSAAGIDGTPGFWVLGPNGKSQKISGAQPYTNFSAAFDGMQ